MDVLVCCHSQWTTHCGMSRIDVVINQLLKTMLRNGLWVILITNKMMNIVVHVQYSRVNAVSLIEWSLWDEKIINIAGVAVIMILDEFKR